MDQDFSAARIERSRIERVLIRMPQADLRQCRQVLQAVLALAPRSREYPSIAPLLKEPGATHAVKLVALFVNRKGLERRGESLIARLAAVRDLAWLRGRLTALSLGRGPAPGRVKSRPTDDAPRGAVAIAYRLCLGREPTGPEVLEWDCRGGDSTGCASAFCDLHDGPESDRYRRGNLALFAPLASSIEGERDVVKEGIVSAYQLMYGRTPARFEIEVWKGNLRDGLQFSEFLRLMYASAEATQYREAESAGISDGLFVQLVHEAVRGYGIHARELAALERELSAGHLNRNRLLAHAFKAYAGQFAAESEPLTQRVHDARYCGIAFTGRMLTPEIWNLRAEELKTEARGAIATGQATRFHIRSKANPLVSAIASLHRGGDFIEQFMDNITSQSCFRDHCELIIVDAESPDNESEVIERYCRQHANIIYRRINYRIGVYEAWNVGVGLARGEYLTNTNVDDLRRADSFELQAGVLDNLPFVDVVYQEFYYSLDSRLSFEEVARFGFRSNLPVVSPHNLMDFNSPHNAPMWRKRLHDELGYFDTSYRSAGDYEFWMRCLVAGKVFYKVNEPHVAYYQNPEGVSTRPDTRGVEEGRRIFKTYARRLVPAGAVMPVEEFAAKILPGVQDLARPGASRYELCQEALRHLSLTRKYSRTPGGDGA